MPVNTAPWASVNTDKQLAEVTARLATDPEWQGGRYAQGEGKSGSCKTALTEIRLETLKRYGNDEVLKPRFPDATERAAAMRRNAADWAAKWDANSLIILRRALLGFDTRPDFAKIKAQVLYVLCRTDALFPPKIAPDVMEALAAAGVEARYFEIDSDLGHSSSGPEHAKWSPVLREFLAPLIARVEPTFTVREARLILPSLCYGPPPTGRGPSTADGSLASDGSRDLKLRPSAMPRSRSTARARDRCC